MKQIYFRSCSRWLILALFLLPWLSSYAQKTNVLALQRVYARQIKFITHAPVLLPGLFQKQQYDSIRNFLTNWENSDLSSEELIFSLRVLLAIETRQSSTFQLPCDCMFYLSDYARELHDMEACGAQFKYYLKLQRSYVYDATEEVYKLLRFIRSRALSLERNGSLDDTALFFCRVLSGEFRNPRAVLKANPEYCPRIVRMEAAIHARNDTAFTAARNKIIGTAALTTGIWLPTGHLKAQGDHPSIGVQLGVRNKWNEYDIVYAFRFIPVPRNYTYLHDDTLRTSSSYNGHFIGLEYTRFLLHKKYFDIGVISGIGVDLFNGIDKADHPPPISLASFNFNNGIRLKYFFRRKSYIGLTAEYHLIHYSNEGGTDLDGDAFSLELSYGSH